MQLSLAGAQRVGAPPAAPRPLVPRPTRRTRPATAPASGPALRCLLQPTQPPSSHPPRPRPATAGRSVPGAAVRRRRHPTVGNVAGFAIAAASLRRREGRRFCARGRRAGRFMTRAVVDRRDREATPRRGRSSTARNGTRPRLERINDRRGERGSTASPGSSTTGMAVELAAWPVGDRSGSASNAASGGVGAAGRHAVRACEG